MSISKVSAIKNPNQEDLIKTCNGMLADAESGRMTGMVCICVVDYKVWEYHIQGILNKFETAGQCMALANITLGRLETEPE